MSRIERIECNQCRKEIFELDDEQHIQVYESIKKDSEDEEESIFEEYIREEKHFCNKKCLLKHYK